MKKIIWIGVCILLMFSNTQSVSAGEYLTYEEITFNQRSHKLLRDFSGFDYNRLYSQLGGRRFFGWRTVNHHENVPLSFKKETLYVIVNEGDSSIRQNFSFKQSEQASRQISVSGSLDLDVSGKIRAFDSGLEAQVSGTYSSERSTLIEETVDIYIEVDPYTKLRVEIFGEGLISNGVGRQYRFFRNVKEGGWEVFTLRSEHYSIIKERLDQHEMDR